MGHLSPREIITLKMGTPCIFAPSILFIIYLVINVELNSYGICVKIMVIN